MKCKFGKSIKKQEALIILDFWRDFVSSFTDSSNVSFFRDEGDQIEILVSGVPIKNFAGQRYIKKYKELKSPDKSLLDMAGEKNYRMKIERE